MARLSPSKLSALKRAFIEHAMQPTQAAQAAGVSYGTAKRYYTLWAEEIKRSLEAKLLPSFQQSATWIECRNRLLLCSMRWCQRTAVVVVPFIAFIFGNPVIACPQQVRRVSPTRIGLIQNTSLFSWRWLLNAGACWLEEPHGELRFH